MRLHLNVTPGQLAAIVAALHRGELSRPFADEALRAAEGLLLLAQGKSTGVLRAALLVMLAPSASRRCPRR